MCDDFGRRAEDRGVRSNILDDDGACAHDCSFANAYSRQNHGMWVNSAKRSDSGIAAHERVRTDRCAISNSNVVAYDSEPLDQQIVSKSDSG